jgi:uncharacterized repeat protein (TIGR01451 family)
MKRIKYMRALLLIVIILVSFSAKVIGQWVPILHDSGVANYGGVDVTVTNFSASINGGCNTLFWLVNDGSSYTFTFSTPVAGIYIPVSAVNEYESVEFVINGHAVPVTNCNIDPVPFNDSCGSLGNCSIVNGKITNDASGFWVLGARMTFYGPISTFTIRNWSPMFGAGSSFDISFSPMGTNIGGCGQSSDLDSFYLNTTKTCGGPEFYLTMDSYIPGLSVLTYFGDGTVDTSVVLSGYNGGYAYTSHTYPFSGTYGIKQVLCQGSNALDSIIVNYDHQFCSNLPIQFYNDINNTCSFDSSDSQPFFPVLVQVDSNNIAVDTISTTAGFYYEAYGHPGDIYKFKIISLPGDMVPVCPSSGEVSDTLQSVVNATKYMGIGCGTSNVFDLAIQSSFLANANTAAASIIVNNNYCIPQNGVLTMTFSPKYIYSLSSIAPVSQIGNTVSWNLSGLSASFAQPIFLFVGLTHNGQLLTLGDTVQSSFSITPTIGDVNTANNFITRHDTVTAPSDPNAVYVSPSGCVLPGTTLQYTVTFENLGNAPAENIYVMDTLSDGVNMQSMKILAASHLMNVTKVSNGGYNILKFEFPNINLPDSLSPDRHGMVMYTIDMKNNFPIGSSVTNKAGIYFDYMPAVLTNVASTTACWPTNVNTTVSKQENILIYPNPATEDLTIKTDKQYTTYTISNSIGQVMMKNMINTIESKVNIRPLAPGIYYISLKGEGSSDVRKFVKM